MIVDQIKKRENKLINNKNSRIDIPVGKWVKCENCKEIKNKLKVGDVLELIIPNKIEAEDFEIKELFDSETGEKIETVNPGKLGQTVKLTIPYEVKQGWILRRKK